MTSFPDTPATRLTEEIMAAWRQNHPDAPSHEHNPIYSKVWRILTDAEGAVTTDVMKELADVTGIQFVPSQPKRMSAEAIALLSMAEAVAPPTRRRVRRQAGGDSWRNLMSPSKFKTTHEYQKHRRKP